MILRTEDPTNVVAQAFDEEASENLEGLNQGSIQLPNKVTMDSSKGFIRDVTYTAGSIRPVDTRGAYNGTYDLLKIIINTAGAIGTAKYDVYEKSSTNLKSNQIITEETINGDYQELAGGLQIRFAGSTDSSVATQNNEFEMEVFGAGERGLPTVGPRYCIAKSVSRTSNSWKADNSKKSVMTVRCTAQQG